WRGRLLLISDSLKQIDATPPDSLRPVLLQGKTLNTERQMEDQKVYSVISPIRDPAGKPAGALEIAQHYSVMEAEKAASAQRRLRDAEKLAGVGRVAAGLAHEVAAPLNVISGRAEMMLKEDMPRAGRERNIRIIVDQIARITTVIRSRLDFARRREPRLGLVD